MNISKSTFYRDISELIQKGIVKKVDEGYSIITELFPIYFSNKIIEEFKAMLEEVRQSYKSQKEFEQSPFYPMYKTFYYYYEKGFEGLKMAPEEFVMNISAGLFSKKKKGNKSVQIVDLYREYPL